MGETQKFLGKNCIFFFFWHTRFSAVASYFFSYSCAWGKSGAFPELTFYEAAERNDGRWFSSLNTYFLVLIFRKLLFVVLQFFFLMHADEDVSVLFRFISGKRIQSCLEAQSTWGKICNQLTYDQVVLFFCLS
jgi:hypothetical protein